MITTGKERISHFMDSYNRQQNFDSITPHIVVNQPSLSFIIVIHILFLMVKNLTKLMVFINQQGQVLQPLLILEQPSNTV